MELIDSLPSLGVGEALISGPAITFPAVVKIHAFHERYSLELGGKDISFHEEWSKPPNKITITPPQIEQVVETMDKKPRDKSLTDFIK